MNPIIPWMGGKRRLVKQILPLFPEHTCYCEPFAGGGAMLFAKPPSKVEVLNDIDGELVNFYRVIKHHMEEFHRQFKHALVSRQIYDWLNETPAKTGLWSQDQRPELWHGHNRGTALKPATHRAGYFRRAFAPAALPG